MKYVLCSRCSKKQKIGVCTFCGYVNIIGQQQEAKYVPLSEAIPSDKDRVKTGVWDVVFGGGIVCDSVTLLGGSPGAGKSTISLQMAGQLGRVLYIAAEEGIGQIKARANRLQIPNQEGIIVVQANHEDYNLTEALEEIRPQAVILDSISGLLGDDFEAQRAVVAELRVYAETKKAPAIIIDHVTKELEFAGRMALQHDVDCTIMLVTGEESEVKMIAIKNRNGGRNVLRLSMTERGLVEYLDVDSVLANALKML